MPRSYSTTKGALLTMATTPNPRTDDESLHAARRAFDDAVQLLTGPRIDIKIDDTGNRIVCTSGSLYAEMTENLAGQQGTAHGGVARSLPPVWVDGLDWIVLVDNTVTAWAPGSDGGTATRLAYLADWSWRPQDAVWLQAAAMEIRTWVESAEELIAGRNRFTLAAACPACGETHVTRTDADGEHVRTPVLQVSRSGASCAACGHEWGLDRLMWLARTLGCDPLDGIDPGVATIIR